MTHYIRLHGPWECWPPEGDPVRLAFPVSLPTIPFDPLPPTIRLIRRFGRPSNLTSDTRVVLEWTNGCLSATVRLESDPTAPRTAAPHEAVLWNLPSPLPWRNALIVQIDLAASCDSQRITGDLVTECRLGVGG